MRSPRVVCDICDHQDCNFFFTLALCLPSCVEVIMFERRVVYSKYRVAIPQWRFFCGRSYMDIVKILLCECEDVEQWLEPQNISSCLRLDLFSQLSSLLYLVLLCIVHIHMLDIVCVCLYLCWTKRASYSTSTLNLEESRRVVPEPFTRNSGSLLVTHSVFSIKF